MDTSKTNEVIAGIDSAIHVFILKAWNVVFFVGLKAEQNVAIYTRWVANIPGIIYSSTHIPFGVVVIGLGTILANLNSNST